MAAGGALGEDVLALDIGGTKIAAAVGDELGRLWRRTSMLTVRSEGAERVMQRAIELAQNVLNEERASGGDVVALGVSTMGLTRDDHVELAPNVPGWDQLALPAALRDAFPDLPIAIGNDVKVATLAELRWGALAGVETGAYLNLGTGVAAGLVIAGDIVEGAHGAAGEIGYWLGAPLDSPVPVATGAAPAEEALGGRGVAGRAAELFGTPFDVVELIEMAHHDERARQLLDDVWAGIAAVAANLAIVWDPEILVLGGGYLRSASPLLERVAATVAATTPFPPAVMRAHFEADASLHGAVALAYRQIVDRPLSGAGAAGSRARPLTWPGGPRNST